MKDVVGDKNPEFWPESHCPFFTLPTGAGSCYSDEMSTALDCLARDGAIKLDNISSALETVFGSPDSQYQIALAKRADKKYPIPGPWLNSGVIRSLDNMKHGKTPPGSDTCEDNDGFTLALSSFLLSKDVEKARSVAQLVTTNNIAMNHFAVQNLILANYINNVDDPITAAKNSVAADNPEVAKEMELVMAAVKEGLSVGEIVKKFGKACGLP